MSTENQVLADLAEQAAIPHEVATGRLHGEAGARTDLLLWLRRHDQELAVVDLEEYAARPARMRGLVATSTAEAFIGYVDRHKDETATTLWSQVRRGVVEAVLDDHDSTGEPGWGDHRVQLQLQPTKDWQHWIGGDGKLQSQEGFAEHLEDGADCVVSPDAATMLEVAQSFHAKRGVNFKSSNRLDCGEVQFVYEESIAAKAGQRGDLSVPDTFTLALAPFEGSAVYTLYARFRYRIADGALRLGYRLVRPDKVREVAFTEICEQITVGLELPVLAGTPRA